MQFVTDILWSSPLGLYINAQDRGGIAQTTDWVKVRGDQLKPRDGLYDVRITADLWETHYFDHVHLTVVDHPADTEMYVDERFFLTPTTPQLYLTKPPRPVARAVDDNGDDVTDVVRRIDGRYLDTFGLGKYQGVARRPLRRGRPRRRRPEDGSGLSTGHRLDSSDRQLHQRRHRAGQATTGRTASSSKCPTARAAGRSAGRRSASRPARTRPS